VVQQIRFVPDVQSLSELQLFGQVFEQTPPQQMPPAVEEAQSESVLHEVGQLVVGRQRDFAVAVRAGSILPALAQQTWPPAVSQSELLVHGFGQSLAGVQTGVE
jgi:hypothetical protein